MNLCTAPLDHRRPGVFGALIELLRQPGARVARMPPLPAELVAAKWNEMVVKCLIKMTKVLSSVIQVGRRGCDGVSDGVVKCLIKME